MSIANPLYSGSASEALFQSGLAIENELQDIEDSIRDVWYPNALKNGAWESVINEGDKITINAYEIDRNFTTRSTLVPRVVSLIEVVDDPSVTRLTIKQDSRGFRYLADKSSKEVRLYNCVRAEDKTWAKTLWTESPAQDIEKNVESMRFWLIGPGDYELVFLPRSKKKLQSSGNLLK